MDKVFKNSNLVIKNFKYLFGDFVNDNKYFLLQNLNVKKMHT